MNSEDIKILRFKCISQGYRELNIPRSKNLDQFIHMFFEHKNNNLFNGQKFFSIFNGHVFKSDEELTEDSIYLVVTGVTKKQYQIDKQQFIEQYTKKYKNHQKHLDVMIVDWVNKGHQILSKRFWDNWDKVVTYRAGSIYLGEELNIVLEIIHLIKEGNTYDVVLNKLIDINPDKDMYLIIKKILWLVGCEGFVQHLNTNVVVDFETDDDKKD